MKNFPGCQYTFGKGFNLTHKKKPYYYEYNFDVKVEISCGNERGTMSCNFIIKEGFEFENHMETIWHPKCHNIPEIGPNKL